MENFTWLWLNDAAQLIASRLIKYDPNKPSNPKTISNEARRQLLDQAHIGSLDIQGKSCDPELEESLPRGDWEVLNSSFWDPDHRPGTGGLSDIGLTIIWENNCLSYEDDQGVFWGYRELRVREVDVDRIWPRTESTSNHFLLQTDISSAVTAEVKKNRGGRLPNKREALFIKIIDLADKDRLPEKAKLKKYLRELPPEDWDPDEDPSPSLIDLVVNKVYERLFPET